MKLNAILAIVLVALIGVTFLLFLDEKPVNPRQSYLFNPIEDQNWSLGIDKGVISRQGSVFLWNKQVIPRDDEELPKVLVKISDFKVIRKVNDLEWKTEMQVEEFSYNGKEYAISDLNELTGRFMLFDKQLREVYLVEDQAPLQELHKSFEVGQKIKYYNLINLINKQSWDL